MTGSNEMEKFILSTFGAANPIYCLSILQEQPPDRRSIGGYITQFLCDGRYTAKLYGNEILIAQRWSVAGRNMPKVEPVYHVFPIVSALNIGFMVPVEVSEAEHWEVSDAFGTFGQEEARSPVHALDGILRRIELAWIEFHLGSVLPLRWRKALSLQLLCPVHFRNIDGESLQVPLVIAVLRAISAKPATKDREAILPFGNSPVFSTGVLCEDDRFGPIEGLATKMEGFVREYGEGLPAILTEKQIGELKGNSLLDAVRYQKADNLKELLQLPDLTEALKRLCEPPHPTEIDRLLGSMERMRRGIRFDDATGLCNWLLPSLEDKPFYRFKLLRQVGLNFAHAGNFLTAKRHLDESFQLILNHPETFGISDRVRLAAALGTLAFDSCSPELVKPLLGDLEKKVLDVSADERARFWGTACQIFRLEGSWDQAVHAGREAVRCADIGDTKNSGWDRNHLIHALIARARSSMNRATGDLDDASRLLYESQGEHAPKDDVRALQSHLGYCLHYEAEIARLHGQAFTPPASPPWKGTWGHPWMFVLLSCARNEKHSYEERIQYAQRLMDFIGGKGSAPEDLSLYRMFRAVYSLYLAMLTGSEISKAQNVLRDWCERIRNEGFPGWGNKLLPILEKIEIGNSASVEELCDAIPYH